MSRSFIILSLVFIFVSGCSMVLHERKKDLDNPKSMGSKTEVSLRGPKAAVSHKF